MPEPTAHTTTLGERRDDGSPHVYFTRALFQRNMSTHPEAILNYHQVSIGVNINEASPAASRRASKGTIGHRIVEAVEPLESFSPLRQSGFRRGSQRRHDSVTTAEETPISVFSTPSTSAHHPCFCQPEPRIPRPRNGKHASITTQYRASHSPRPIKPIRHSFHTVPTAPSYHRERSEFQFVESGYIEDHRRAVEERA